MEFLTDWKFWAFFIMISGIVINFLANHKIMNNHLHHLAVDIKSILTKQDEQGKEITEIKTEVAYIKGIEVGKEKLNK